MANTKAPPEEILELIIRFTASIPDLTVPVKSPKATTTLALKQLIRERLPEEHGNKRLRLIFSGRILEDATSLYQSLGLKDAAPALPPARSAKALGKQPLRDDEAVQAAVRRKYIHCSIGDLLSKSDLEEEAQKAREAKEALLASLGQDGTTSASVPGRAGSSDEMALSICPSWKDNDMIHQHGIASLILQLHDCK